MSWEHQLVIPPFTNQSIRHVPNVCNICNGSHYTGLCSSLSEQHIQDKPHHDNLSRYSVPDGLLIIDCEEPRTTIAITAQKFAKGTRFGPLLAPKSYVPPSRPNKFPLVVFNEVWNGDPFLDELSDDIKELFNVRNYYLDTSDENKCNWMIHVDIAKYSNEQNLMAYQENDQIYYTSTRDIELGDILKVWYSPSYATRMGASLLEMSINPSVCTNILRQVSFDYGIKLHEEADPVDIANNNYLAIAPLTSSPSSEITLPPINSLMKTQSPNYNNLDFDNLILMAKNDHMANSSYQNDYMDSYQISLHDQMTSSDSEKMNQSPSSSVKNIKFTEMQENETQKYACELCARKYITKSNLEKHMRSHDLYMCVVCMKMFQNPDELKEHDCFKHKTSAKKSLFHCNICWKVLSNSWSLNRHMKIHRNIATPETVTNDKLDDLPDEFLVPVQPTPVSHPEPEIFNIEPQQEIDDEIEDKSIETCLEPMMENFMTETDPLDVNSWLEPNDYQQSHQQIQQNDQSPMSYEDTQPNPPNFDKCIVCARIFKNPNSLEKHLRNVHTAHVIRPELTTSIKKSSEYRRIVLNKKPIKENVAKALVSKLSKKNQQQVEPPHVDLHVNQGFPEAPVINWNGIDSQENNQTMENGNTIIIISNVEINPANSPITSNGYTFANYQSNAIMPKLVPIGTGLKISDETELNTESTNPSPKVFIIDKVGGEPSKVVQKPPKACSPDDLNEHHQCPECDKVFQKKYQLKRHQEIHENLFYFCPFCKRAPVKARSSLRKHFVKDHPEHQETWQVSNFMSTLLRKYEKVKKSSQESHDSTKKAKKEPKVKKEPKKKNKQVITMTMEPNDQHCEIINDEPLPQGNHDLEDGDEDNHQNQQIILSNLFLDPITLDEENNLIKYTLAGDDDFIMNGGHNGSGSGNMTHAGSIESYEMSEFSNFKSSFDEIQEKLDADLEFNNDQMIKWSDELNDDDSSVISSPSASNLSSPENLTKSLSKQKKLDSFMLS